MATGKTRTNEEKNRATDKRLQHKFGITLADRTQRIQEQANKCKICGGPLDAYGPPCIDHFHFFVKAERMTAMGWRAQAFDECKQVKCSRLAATKAQAIADVKKAMMPWSIRGMLCWKCNRGLGFVERFFDAARHPEKLLAVIDYLRARLK